jgi:hypothetical protein
LQQHFQPQINTGLLHHYAEAHSIPFIKGNLRFLVHPLQLDAPSKPV